MHAIRRLFCLLMIVAFAGTAAAQEAVWISGRVVDAETGLGVADVSVFVANTTAGSSTDSTGHFRIDAITPGLVELVASAIGFEPQARTVDLSAGAVDSLTIRLRPTAYELAGVAVEAERPRGWRRDLERFEELFLGTSDNARETEILNPYVLDFQRDRDQFRATASEPLLLENRALGYRITYVLGGLFEGRQSTARYTGRYTMSYTGQIFFEEMQPRDADERARWEENRRASFDGSLQHFLWALARDRLKEEGFDLRPGYETDLGRIAYRPTAEPVDPKSLLNRADRPGYFVLRTETPLVVMHESPRTLGLFGLDIPIGTGTDVSTLVLRDPAALVHVTGYAHSPLGAQNPLAVAGSMSRRRVADMLPRDYVRTWEATQPAALPIVSGSRANGTVRGLVVDAETGRAVPGAVVTAVAANGQSTSVRTGRDGAFELTSAELLTAAAPGFLRMSVAPSASDRASVRLGMQRVSDVLLRERGFGSNLAFASMEEAGPRPSSALGDAAGLLREREWKKAEEALGAVLERDTANVEARYFRAIAAREQGKLHLPLQAILPNNAVDRSRRDFELLVRSHANYRDVLFQAALLEWYDGRYQRAVELAHAQVLIDPDQIWAQLGLHRLGQSLLHRATTEEIDTFVESRRAPYYRFLAAESRRLAGRLDEAKRLLADIPPTGPLRVPVNLSRARIAFAGGDAEAGQRLVEQAIDGIETPLDAWFLMEDVKVILEPGELDRFVAATSAEGHRQFFRGFWTRRDPDRATPENERLAEHYARLAVAERDYYFDGLRAEFNTPDVHVTTAPGASMLAPRVEYPDAYWLNHAFDDRGLIYVRHGEPSDRAFDINADRSNLSWRYYRDGAPLDFHFVVSEFGAHDNWRLVPHLPDDMLASRGSWGHPYNSDGWNVLDIIHRNQDAITAALSTDTYAWGTDVEPLDVPRRVALFRGTDGRSLLRLYYAVSVDADEPEDSVRVSMTIHDRDWTPAFSESGTPKGAFVFETELAPDTFHVAFHMTAGGGRRVGAYRWSQVVPSFGTAFSMSDVVLLHVATTDRDDAVRWGNPTGRHDRSRPLPLYFEIYGLTFDGDDQTSYEIEYRLEPLESRRGLLGILRGDEGATLTLRTELTGATRDAEERSQIDVSGVRAGTYRLYVTVRDRTSGASETRALDVELF
ncbi:MAG TPA: carboxypeptidase regulatory-like domain-containing protein [Rhodothermales bacterium]